MKTRNIIDAVAGYKARTGYQNPDIRCALIDMDGTLYDSMPFHARAWQRMVSELGIDCKAEEFFAYEGMTGKATINLLMQRAFGKSVTDEEAAALYAKKSQYFKEIYEARIMPGAKELVGTLIQKGITPILVTGSGQASLMERLSDDFDGAFPPDLRVTSRDVKIGKPSPEPYLMGLKIGNVQPWEAIVVENAPLGVQSGVNAGIFTIGVNTGPIAEELLWEAGADIVFDSMVRCAESLTELLDKLNNS